MANFSDAFDKFYFSWVKDFIGEHKDSVIVCLGVAADCLGLSENWFYPADFGIPVYSNKKIRLNCFKLIYLPNCFTEKEHILKDGIFVTSEEQTLLDLIEYESSTSKGIIDPTDGLCIAMSNYWKNHNMSFDGLEGRVPEEHKKFYERLKECAPNFVE